MELTTPTHTQMSVHKTGEIRTRWMGCIDFSFLVVMLCYGHERCYHLGNLGKSYIEYLYHFKQLHVNQ